MTTDPTPDERLDAFVAELRRFADLIAEGAVPVPSISPVLSWYVRGDDAHEQAAGIARALAPEWQANPYNRDDSGYLSATASVGGIGYDVSVRLPEVVEPPESRSVAFAVALTASAAEAPGAALELVEDDPGPDLRACCDHEAHEPDECSVPGCDCDGDGPTVAVDR